MFLTCFNFKCSNRKKKKHGNKRIRKKEFQTNYKSKKKKTEIKNPAGYKIWTFRQTYFMFF